MKKIILFLSVSVMLITVGCQKQINDPAHSGTSSQKKLPTPEFLAEKNAKLQKDIEVKIKEDTKIFSNIVAEYKAKRKSSGISAKKKLIQVPRDYATIQEAVDNASDGATINVSGSYTESVVMWNRKDVTINGVGNATLSYSYPFTFGILNSSGIIIKGFNLVGRLAVEDCVGVEIKNNDISGEGNGIDLYYVDNSTIKNNTIHDMIPGGLNGASGFGNGIALLISNHNIIKNNHTSNNYLAGIELIGSSQNMIQSNVSNGDVHGNFTGGGISFYSYLGGSDSNTVYNNKVSGSYSGILIDILGRGSCSDNVLKGDQTNSNNTAGIILVSSLSSHPVSGTIIDNCISNNNSFSGLYFIGVMGNLVTGTTANNNNVHGFMFWPGSSNNTIKNSRATGNACDYYDLGTDNISQNNRFGNICY